MCIEDIEAYAKVNNIPIMQKEGINYLVSYIKESNIKKILEIGSAIGYSAIKMALVSVDIRVITLEKDIIRYNEAIKNINDFKLNKQIEIYNIDALEYISSQKYDLIFIDAAKSKYLDFFLRFKDNLNKGGVIISDNMNFHGLTKNVDEIKSRNLRSLVKKINNYRDFLIDNSEFKTTFIDKGDGISVSIKID